MEENRLKKRVFSVVFVLIGLTILFAVIGMVFFWRTATTPKQIISVATGDDVILIESERERLTRLPVNGLPEELHEVTPVYEVIWGGVQKQPLNAQRLYEDRSYYIFSITSGTWKYLGKVGASTMPELLKLLTSESVFRASSDAGRSNPVKSARYLYRINLNGETKEVIYGTGHGEVDPVFSEIRDLILRNCR